MQITPYFFACVWDVRWELDIISYILNTFTKADIDFDSLTYVKKENLHNFLYIAQVRFFLIIAMPSMIHYPNFIHFD